MGFSVMKFLRFYFTEFNGALWWPFYVFFFPCNSFHVDLNEPLYIKL